MKAVFEVKTIKSDWAPPFKKDITTQEYEVSANEEFDRIIGNGNDSAVFRLIEAGDSKAKVQYSELFTLKTPQGQDKILILGKGEEEAMTYLWGEKGITKKIVYKGLKITQPSYVTALETEAQATETQNTEEPIAETQIIEESSSQNPIF